MKLEYSIKCSGAGFLDIEIKPNKSIEGYLPNISGWLSSDVQNMSENYFIPIFNKVLTEISDEEIISGNAYEAVIHKDYTTISYVFEYCNPKIVPCTLPTEMLYELLQIWGKAYEEHYKNKD